MYSQLGVIDNKKSSADEHKPVYYNDKYLLKIFNKALIKISCMQWMLFTDKCKTFGWRSTPEKLLMNNIFS